MITFKTLQNMFAREIGELDYTAIDNTLKNILNDSYRYVTSRHPYTALRKTASSTIASGELVAPTDIDYAHISENTLYSYSGTDKTEYSLVGLSDVDSYDTDSCVYAIDQENGKIISNQDAAIKFEYQAVPAELSGLTDTIKIPIPEVISACAANTYWNGVEGEEKRAEKALAKSEELLKRSVFEDVKTKPAVTIPHYLSNRDLGY